MIKLLNSLDSNWNNLLGYLSFYSSTLLLYDLHIDYDQNKQVVDCTHFLYIPYSFNFLWDEMILQSFKLKRNK